MWWDRQIVPGQTVDREIERALEGAKAVAVVVLWSSDAVASNTALSIDLAASPPSLSYAPRMVLNFSGRRQTP